MILGEFEWQTAEQVQQQVAVNLLGTMGITRKLMPLVRANRSRIVMITSHCAYESLPGLSVYGATKAALLAWSTSLRTELAKYGVKIVSFIPGQCENSVQQQRPKKLLALREESIVLDA